MTRQELQQTLRDLDGKSYKAYKQIRGSYDFGDFELRIDHVQGDPFADASRVSALIPAESAKLPPEALASPIRRTAAADFLNRHFATALRDRATNQGSGQSGELSILEPGQEVLKRSSMTVFEDGAIEARFRVGLPARGRRILGDAAADLVGDRLAEAVGAALLGDERSDDELIKHAEVVEDARALRDALPEHGLIAFVADGASLPRRSGVDDRPLEGPEVVPFESPDSLRVTLETPNGGPVTGMGVREGVTLLVGGGFHGKSTLLRALQLGVYDHLPGDGRERVVSVPQAVKVRAEDGRSIRGTDISAFIDNLPNGADTSRFVTANASGSTSQAAAISEALQLGCDCLLIDEDTSATNFLIRDARVQRLIAADNEPITPFIDRVVPLKQSGVSMVIVVGGSGDFFDVADTVVAMKAYRPEEVTAESRTIMDALPTLRDSEGRSWSAPEKRVPAPSEIDPRRGRRDIQIKAYGPHRLGFGTEELDLSALEQLVEAAQTRAIARVLAWAREECIDGERPVDAALRCVMDAVKDDGLDRIDDRRLGEYAEFRIFEVAAVLNRLRGGRLGS